MTGNLGTREPQLQSLSTSSPNTAAFLPLTDATGVYRSEEVTPSLFARWFPTLTFYTVFLADVLRYSWKAQRGRYGDAEWYQSSLGVLRTLEKIGARIQITGMNFVASLQGPCVFVANHMSTLETIFLPGIVQPYKDCTFVVKRAVIEYPVFKHILLTRAPIAVDRVNPREDLLRVLSEGKALLEKGRSIIVFPQTTRTLRFDPAQFNTIGVKLARDAGVPIIPVAVRSDAWGIGRWIKEFGKIDPRLPVSFAFGEPVRVTGRGTAAHQAVIDHISTHLREWGVAVETPPAGLPQAALSGQAPA